MNDEMEILNSLSTYPHAASASGLRFADATNAYIVKLLEQFRA